MSLTARASKPVTPRWGAAGRPATRRPTGLTAYLDQRLDDRRMRTDAPTTAGWRASLLPAPYDPLTRKGTSR